VLRILQAGIFEQKEPGETKSQPVNPPDDGEASAAIFFEGGELL
jgi:hypothetical protein